MIFIRVFICILGVILNLIQDPDIVFCEFRTVISERKMGALVVLIFYGV